MFATNNEKIDFKESENEVITVLNYLSEKELIKSTDIRKNISNSNKNTETKKQQPQNRQKLVDVLIMQFILMENVITQDAMNLII